MHSSFVRTKGKMSAPPYSTVLSSSLSCPRQVMRVLARQAAHAAQQEVPAALCRPPHEPSASPLSATMLSQHLAVQDLQTPQVAPAG